jgi:hypothetical protein
MLVITSIKIYLNEQANVESLLQQKDLSENAQVLMALAEPFEQ